MGLLNEFPDAAAAPPINYEGYNRGSSFPAGEL